MTSSPKLLTDVNDLPVPQVWVPNTGWVIQQGATASTDTSGITSAVIATSGGSGGSGATQYTDAGTPPANPVGGAIMFDNSGAWVDVGVDHPLPVSGTFTPAANQRVNAQASDFLTNSIVDLSTLLTLSGTPSDANTVNSLIGRLTKIRDLLLGTLTVSQSGALPTGTNSIGAVTANAGSNLNTSSLALEAGHLATIDTHTPALGSAAKSASTPVTIATDDTLLTNTTGLATQTTLASILTGINTLVTDNADVLADGDNLATINTNTAQIPTKGAAVTSASTPVNIASDQTVPVKRSAVAAYTLASTTTSGATQNSSDIAVGAYTEVSIDINTTAQVGTSPTIQYFYERKGADGIYYVIWQSAVLTVAANTVSTSVGAGMAYNQSLGLTGRLRWVITGSATPTFTHSLNIYGK